MTAQRRNHRRRARSNAEKQGAPPGTPVYTGDVLPSVPVQVRVFDYGPEAVRESDAFESSTLAAYKNDDSVTWINFDGIHKTEEVQAVCAAFGVHSLWVEDIVNPSSRAKTEMLDDKVLVVARMLRPGEAGMRAEQVSLVLGTGWVLTFQERDGDVWEALRTRIRTGNGRVRKMHADYLLHALLDDIVDHYFLALEQLEGRVDTLEAKALHPQERLELPVVFALKNELADFRRTVWPMRESVSALLRVDGTIGPTVQPYFRDLYDHIVQVMDILETSRERVVGVYELHLAVTGHRLNDIMKILTIVSTIFIPMTFIAGVYGMNFEHMPELRWQHGYLYVWVLMLGSAVLGGVLMYSRRWLA